MGPKHHLIFQPSTTRSSYSPGTTHTKRLLCIPQVSFLSFCCGTRSSRWELAAMEVRKRVQPRKEMERSMVERLPYLLPGLTLVSRPSFTLMPRGSLGAAFNRPIVLSFSRPQPQRDNSTTSFLLRNGGRKAIKLPSPSQEALIRTVHSSLLCAS